MIGCRSPSFLIDCDNERTDASLIGLRRLSGVGTSLSIATVSTCGTTAGFGLGFALGMFLISNQIVQAGFASDRAVAKGEPAIMNRSMKHVRTTD